MTRPTEVSAAEAARRLGIDKATAARWLHSGKMHGTRTAGGHWRVSLEELERLREESAEMSADATRRSLTQALAHLASVEAGATDPELRRLAHRAVLATEHAVQRAAKLQ